MRDALNSVSFTLNRISPYVRRLRFRVQGIGYRVEGVRGWRFSPCGTGLRAED